NLKCRVIGPIALALSFMLEGCGGSTTPGADADGISINGGAGSLITGGAGNGATLNIDAACVASAREGEAIPVNLLFLVDRSGSMSCPLGPSGQTCGLGNNQAPAGRTMPDRWSAITDALNAFINAPSSAGIGVALQFFPTGADDEFKSIGGLG